MKFMQNMQEEVLNAIREEIIAKLIMLKYLGKQMHPLQNRGDIARKINFW